MKLSLRTRIVLLLLLVVIFIGGNIGVIWFHSHHGPATVEEYFDPRLLFSEIDDTLAVPLPPPSPLTSNLVRRTLASQDLFIQTTHRRENLPSAQAYYGAHNGIPVAFVYPPESFTSQWSIHLQHQYVEKLKLGPFSWVLKTNRHIWKSPSFNRTSGSYLEYNRAKSTVKQGTELYYRHARDNYGMVGTVTRRETRPNSDAQAPTEQVEVQFINGARQWFPVSTLTNYFVELE